MLPKDLDLRPFGMCLILDGEKNQHFTLIPAIQPAPCVHRCSRGPKPDIMELKPRTVAPPAPECIKIQPGPKTLLAFPVMAKQFQLHDFLMKAAGLPFDIGSGGGDDKKKKTGVASLPSDIDSGGGDGGDDKKKLEKLGVASNLVFEHSGNLPNTYGISCALDDLCMSGFDLEKLSTFSLHVLHTTMGELLSTSEGVIDDDEERVLGEGIEFIDEQIMSNNACTPSDKPEPPDVPVEGPVSKVAKLDGRIYFTFIH